MDWVKRLNIKNFRGVFSRDNLPNKMNKIECGIINLDDKVGDGTHWVAYYNNYYFDSYGISAPLEVMKYISNCLYNTLQYQTKRSVLCGFYCLYFIKMLQDGHNIYDVLYKKLNPPFPLENEKIILHYFGIEDIANKYSLNE